MILNPAGTDTFFEKADIKLDERTSLKKAYGPNKIYFCSCNRRVPYRLSKDNRFYPCDKSISHEKDCPESEFYKVSQRRMKAYKESDEDGFSAKARIRDFNNKPSENSHPKTNNGRKCYASVETLTWKEYLEILFLSAYETMKRSKKIDKKDVYKIAYAKICSTDINYRGKNFKLKSDETPFKLFYGKLEKIEKDEENPERYNIVLNGRSLVVKEEDMKDAVEEFKNTYNTSLKRTLLCTVIRYKSKYRIESAYFSKTKIIFYPISEKGCICSSAEEQEIFNVIEKMEEDQTAWYFSKPYEYGFGAYGDAYLEDGIITIRKNNKKVCLETSLNKEREKYFINNGKYFKCYLNVEDKQIEEKVMNAIKKQME